MAILQKPHHTIVRSCVLHVLCCRVEGDRLSLDGMAGTSAEVERARADADKRREEEANSGQAEEKEEREEEEHSGGEKEKEEEAGGLK